MATTIRLQRRGANKKPFYRVIVADSRMPRDGRFIDMLGTYDPNYDPVKIKLDQEKVNDWLSKGALPSRTVSWLIKQAKATAAPKRLPSREALQPSPSLIGTRAPAGDARGFSTNCGTGSPKRPIRSSGAARRPRREDFGSPGNRRGQGYERACRVHRKGLDGPS